jgi:hypothetical protein
VRGGSAPGRCCWRDCAASFAARGRARLTVPEWAAQRHLRSSRSCFVERLELQDASHDDAGIAGGLLGPTPVDGHEGLGWVSRAHPVGVAGVRGQKAQELVGGDLCRGDRAQHEGPDAAAGEPLRLLDLNLAVPRPGVPVDLQGHRRKDVHLSGSCGSFSTAVPTSFRRGDSACQHDEKARRLRRGLCPQVGRPGTEGGFRYASCTAAREAATVPAVPSLPRAAASGQASLVRDLTTAT